MIKEEITEKQNNEQRNREDDDKDRNTKPGQNKPFEHPMSWSLKYFTLHLLNTSINRFAMYTHTHTHTYTHTYTQGGRGGMSYI